MLREAKDFADESDALHQLIGDLPEQRFETVTQFKGWTIDDIVQHLQLFNLLVDLSLLDEAAFERDYEALRTLRENGASLVEATDRMLGGLRGHALVETWRETWREIGEHWFDIDPKRRVKWVGPSMSARSSISARLMETWAHAQAIYDVLGAERRNTDRIRSIAVLGINTFGWTFSNRGEAVPDTRPYVRLAAPSSEIWEWGKQDCSDRITGRAEEFCQVVTQVRNVADTGLKVTGETARAWMAQAQCFAGPPNDPPMPGTRFRQAG